MIIPAAPFPSEIHWLTLVLSPVSKSVWGWQLKHRDWDVIQEVFTVAPTGVSGGTIIRAVTVAGRRGNNRFGGEGSARTGPLQLLCWFTWRAEVEESAWITRDREDAAEDVSLNLNAAVYQMPLIPSQVWLIRNRRQHPMSEWNRWAEAHRETFARAENINTNTDVRSLPPTAQEQRVHADKHKCWLQVCCSARLITDMWLIPFNLQRHCRHLQTIPHNT